MSKTNQIIVTLAIFFNLISCSTNKRVDIDCYKLIKNNKLTEFKRIINENPNMIGPTTKYKTSLLHHSISAKNYEATNFLIKKGALEIERRNGNNPLCWAILVGNIDIFKLIINNSNRKFINMKDAWRMSPLLLASGYAQSNILALLIKNGALLNIKDYSGRTPLHWAVLTSGIGGNYSWGKERKRCANIILNAAKDKKKLILEEDNNGYNVFHAACRYNNIDFVKYCLDNNIVNVNAVNYKNGETALHIACYNGFTKLVDILLKYNADVMIKTIDGQTALHANSAWGYGNEKIAKLLIAKGVNINALDKKNKTALDYAIENKNQKLIDFLRKNGAKTAKQNNGTRVQF